MKYENPKKIMNQVDHGAIQRIQQSKGVKHKIEVFEILNLYNERYKLTVSSWFFFHFGSLTFHGGFCFVTSLIMFFNLSWLKLPGARFTINTVRFLVRKLMPITVVRHCETFVTKLTAERYFSCMHTDMPLEFNGFGSCKTAYVGVWALEFSISMHLTHMILTRVWSGKLHFTVFTAVGSFTSVTRTYVRF